MTGGFPRQEGLHLQKRTGRPKRGSGSDSGENQDTGGIRNEFMCVRRRDLSRTSLFRSYPEPFSGGAVRISFQL